MIDRKHEEIEIFNVLSYEWINDFKIIQIYPPITGQNKNKHYEHFEFYLSSAKSQHLYYMTIYIIYMTN